MASITLSPTSGKFDTVIMITGSGFAATTAITIKYDGKDVVTTPTTITTDGSGDFSATITPPNRIYGTNTISATDGTSTATADFVHNRKPEYCTVNDIADWLRIDINANTDPNASMIEDYIVTNEDIIDRETGHTWLTDKVYRTDTFNAEDVYHYGHGMYIPIKHRQMKLPWDTNKGDKFEIWNGIEWVDQTVNTPDVFINFEDTKGVLYIRGFIYTILRKNRFRLTYRYGGDKEGETIPRDIKRACVLLTAIDILSTDFKMSQIPYGGEGNIEKKAMIDKWDEKAKRIIQTHSEILTVY